MSLLAKSFRNSALGKQVKEKTARYIRSFDSHSPMFRNRNFNEERRSRLFSDRPFIWGRLPKYLIAWCLSMQFWAGYYLYHKNLIAQNLHDKTKKANRRTLPFVQAMEDVRFVAIQERNYMILKSVCDATDPRQFDLLRSRYNQEDAFLSYYIGTTFKNYYDGRFGGSRFWNLRSTKRPEDERGLVGSGEQSVY